MDSSPTPSERNAEQIEYWNGAVGARWADLADRLDGLFADLTEALVDHAAPEPGSAVFDIGCGCGATLLALARRLSRESRILGVDISQPMLDVAAARVKAAAVPGVRLALADAAYHPFVAGSWDLGFSRFGVMFFDRPVEAFANLRQALRPGGRLVFACWRLFADNPWMSLPYRAALPHLAEQPPSDPRAPGPFALADADRTRHILAEAGFAASRFERYDTRLRIAAPGDIDDAVRLVVQLGPTSRVLATADAVQRAAAESAIRTALAARNEPAGVMLEASLWFVTAQA